MHIHHIDRPCWISQFLTHRPLNYKQTECRLKCDVPPPTYLLLLLLLLPAESEDDGWLLVYVYHEKEEASKLHIYNAHSMSDVPVAVVRLPQRVPYGFHSTWVTEQQVAAQLPAVL